MIIGDMEIRLRADIARLQRDMDSARQVVGNATAGMERAANAAKAAIASIAAGLGIQELGRMVDEYAKFTAQLKLASMSQREYAAAYADVKRISTSAQQDLQATGMLYARIANGTRELGTTQKQVASITETVNLALKVSGATASESASAQLQLSQAFAAGALRGEEFNAVNESAPRLMQALADGIGVPVGALKKMAEQGQITSQIMADVLPNALTKLREESKEIQTISGAFTVLRNNMMEFVGIQANASGAVSGVVSAISLLSNNLTLLAGAITTLAVSKLTTMLAGWGMETYRQVAANNALRTSTLAGAVASTEAAAVISNAKLAEAQANVRTAATAATLANARVAELRTAVMAAEGEVALAIATNGLIPAQTRAIALSEALSIAHAQQAIAANGATVAAGAAGAALTAQAAATGIAARAMGVLRGAMMFMGGPIGTVVTLLGVAATAWMVWSNKAKDANEKAAASTVETTAEMIGRLDKQIEKLKERNRLQGGAEVNPKIKELGEISEADKDTLQRAREDIDAAMNGTGRFADRTPAKRKLAITNLTEEYEKVLQRVKEKQDEVAVSKEQAFAAKYSEWQGKNGTPAQKEAYDLEQLRKEYGRVTPEMEKWVKAKYADKSSVQAIKAEANAYQNLISSIREKSAAGALELQGYNTLSESQKMAIKLDAEIGTGKNKLSANSINQARAEIALLETQEMAIEAKQQAAKWAEVEAKNDSDHYDSLRAGTAAIDDQIKQYEKQIETYGLSASAAIDMEKAKLEAKLAAGPATYAELIALDEQISKMGKLADLARNKEGMEVSTEAAKKASEDWKRAGEEINRSLTDALLRGFESGKGFGKNLVDTLKNMFNTLVLRPVISAIVNPVAGAVTGALGLAGTAQAATGGGGVGVGSVASGLGTLGSLTSGVGLLGAGGLGLQAGFGALMSSGFAGIGAAVSGGIAAIGAGTGASIAAGMGTIAGALGPIALGIGAAVAIWKKFDTSGTKHTGGAATSSSAGTSAIKAQSLNMADIRTSAEAQKMVEGLTQGIVGILDSTALAFGKTAGYTAATAFADDTSKDGAWGSLMIQKLGQTVVNWQDTRGGTKWAPKTFADGEKGQEQYLAALTSSVRGALDSIGLPDWARTMLNGVASNASLENLAQVVEQINVTQAALGAMRSQLIGFSSMSDSEVSALMAAAGGIDKLFGNASAYYDAFYTEAEKNAVVTEQVAKSLAAVNLQMPATKEGYRALLEAQMKLGPAGAESVAVLFASAAAFAQVTAEAQIATDKNAEFEATLSKHRSALTDAYNAESDAISSTIDRMGSFAASLRGLRESALLGDLSPLSPQEKYAEAKAQYETVLAAARVGDESAQSDYSAAFNSFLSASRAVFASSGQYQADFAYAQASTAEAERWAGAQVDVGKAQLDALKLSVSGLITIDKSVLSVRDAILQMHQVMGTTAPVTPTGIAAPPQVYMPTPVMYASYGADNTVALVAELKSVRQELASLRAEQAVQTGHLIQANAKAASDSADQISGATTTAVKSVANSEQRVAFA